MRARAEDRFAGSIRKAALQVQTLLESIRGEIEAIELYTAFEKMLRSEGYSEDADIVLEILNDEKDHLAKFQAMLRRWRPK